MRQSKQLREYVATFVRLCLFATIAGWSWSAGATHGGAPGLGGFMSQANDLFAGKGDDFKSYVELHDEYRALSLAEKKQAGQLLSMVDAMFGRYEDADLHYTVSFPSSDHLMCPSLPYAPTLAESSIVPMAQAARILMFNESHSKVATRAAIIRMLPALRKAGYTHLALEAINPAGFGTMAKGVTGTSRALLADNVKAGFYLREPIYAKLVEDALGLGFTLVPYESEAVDHEGREMQQAANLQRWLDDHPHERLVVIAGYSHIWKSDGWMAQRLAASSHQSVLAVDQIDGIEGCKGAAKQDTPLLWVDPKKKAWSARPDRVDATVAWRPVYRRGDAASWLSLGGRRKAVNLGRACHGAVPCLISAVVVGAEGSVPEDRLMLFGPGEQPVLYLTPGKYTVGVRTTDRQDHFDIVVDGNGLAAGSDS